ncbi:rhodanese-like domain-containing protein [Paraburkholderia xenovorans]|uniref:rhodanese-like domain-containing protein n=1 Tax=Paraburkholderia xenovorans TaxID=36873 RepID=UPI0015C530B3|nr:rhodanese-like domain-containing protein [Paraburkholderia xenovorans]NPT39547.1 sulfurtransferase [Paraburkholderia xenovorans]
MTQPKSISAQVLRALIDCPPHELAILDVSEEGQFGERHLLHAVNVPYSQLEVVLGPLVPRLATRIVLIDHGARVAERAAARLSALGYTDVSVLDGGIDAWSDAGFALFEGVYVHSKAFGEWLERVHKTPSITAQDLYARSQAGQCTVIFDPRTVAEHASRHVPGAVAVPGQELLKAFDDLVPSADTLIVVACGGRTRGIVGAQTLIDAGVPNRVVALDGGNHGWQLAGFPFERGLREVLPVQPSASVTAALERADRMRERFAIPSTTQAEVEAWLTGPDSAGCTTYVLDVRLPDEYETSHYVHAHSAPGGQLVQATDRWLATRGARVVLVDDDGIRATPTALRLRQMGWNAYVLSVVTASGDWAVPGTRESVGIPGCAVGLPDPDRAAYVGSLRGPAPRYLPEIGPVEARAWLAAGATGVSFDRSADYLEQHPAGFQWANRADAGHLVDALLTGRRLVLFSVDTAAAQLAGIDLLEAVQPEVGGRLAVLAGGMQAWIEAGLPVGRADPDSLDRVRRIDHLYWLHRRRQGDQQEMREYLAWEHSLLARIDQSGEPFPAWPQKLISNHKRSES